MSIFKKERGSASACRRRDGFTLIELLVVVAIIGLLASITLGYLGDARKKGYDTAVKSNLHTTKLEVETFYLDNGSSYGGSFGPETCPLYSGLGTIMFSQNKVIADSIAEAVKNGDRSSCFSSPDFWAVAVGLKSDVNTSWCVDTQGVAKLVNYGPSQAIDVGTHLCN